VLIVDDIEFIKKGTVSAGVQRQYPGTAGRTENCEIGMFAAYASSRGRALVDRELYLPNSWTFDPERCAGAKIPNERAFATKGDLAKAVIMGALASPLPIAWGARGLGLRPGVAARRMLKEAGVGGRAEVPARATTTAGPCGTDWLPHAAAR
jgi:hypothetical protein